MEFKMEIKEILEKGKGLQFVCNTPPDAEAAFKRLKITRKTLKDFKAAINTTNTTDVPDTLKELYAEVYALMLAIEVGEQELIKIGE